MSTCDRRPDPDFIYRKMSWLEQRIVDVEEELISVRRRLEDFPVASPDEWIDDDQDELNDDTHET